MAADRNRPSARRAAAAAVLVSLLLAACSGTGTPGGTAAGKKLGARARAGPGAVRLLHWPATWPAAQSAYFGRYRLIASTDRSFARSALLTLFLREIKKPREMTVPSGVLSAFAPGQTTVLYLSRLRNAGPRGMADVSAGNFGYPPVGEARILGFDQHRHLLMLAFSPSRGRTVRLSFLRYSANPHP